MTMLDGGIIAAVFNAPNGPKCAYHSSTNGNTYCLAEDHPFRIVVLDCRGAVAKVYEPSFTYTNHDRPMMDKMGRFFELISDHINGRAWE
jgi:hypothetical protein